MIRIFRLPGIDNFVRSAGTRTFEGALVSFGILCIDKDIFIFFENDSNPSGIIFCKTERPLFIELADRIEISFFHKELLLAKSAMDSVRFLNKIRFYSSMEFINNVMRDISPDMNFVISVRDCYDYLIKVIENEAKSL